MTVELKGIRVPSKFYGLCIKEAYNIHDWILSNSLNRNYPLTKNIASSLSLTSEQLDDMFIEASKL